MTKFTDILPADDAVHTFKVVFKDEKTQENKFKPGDYKRKYEFEYDGKQGYHYVSGKYDMWLQTVANQGYVKGTRKVFNGNPWIDFFPAGDIPVSQVGDNTPPPPQQQHANVPQKDSYYESDEFKEKGIMISLAGLMQAHISAGKTNEEAISLAVEARAILKKAASTEALIGDAAATFEVPAVKHESEVRVENLPF